MLGAVYTRDRLFRLEPVRVRSSHGRRDLDHRPIGILKREQVVRLLRWLQLQERLDGLLPVIRPNISLRKVRREKFVQQLDLLVLGKLGVCFHAEPLSRELGLKRGERFRLGRFLPATTSTVVTVLVLVCV